MCAGRLAGALLLLAASASIASAAADKIALIQAVKTANRQAVAALLKKPVDVNAPEPDGTTALHWAVHADDLATVQLLLRSGANAKSANAYGSTPLDLAAVNGNAAVLEALLKAGADPNTKGAEGETVLMTAARTGRPEAVKVLLDRGADPNAREDWLGETPLMLAAGENHVEAVRLLITAGASLDTHSKVTQFPRKVRGQTILPVGGLTALMFGARQGAIESTRALIDAGARLDEVDPDGTTALILAIINSHFDLAAMLIEKGADPNIADKAGMAALYAAVDMHTLPFMHGLPIQKSSDRVTAVDLVNRLLEHKADPNQPMKAAVMQRHNNVGNLNLGEGTTPLLRAAKSGDLELMKVLLKAGADPGRVQKNGTTMLMLAAGFGRRFDQNADAQEFETATEADLFEAVKFCVLELKADVNAANNAGDTALHWAGGDSIPFLVEHGANLNAANKQGKTPLDAALARKDRSDRQLRAASVAALQKLGAKSVSPTTGHAEADAIANANQQ
jgi:uncharacterized protein